MEEMMQPQDEFGLLDIVKLLLRKVKWIILSFLICAVLGGTLGYFRTRNTEYFGTNILFYVNPDDSVADTNINSEVGIYGSYKDSVMDTVMLLLSTDRFAEMLLLEPNGLPSAAEVESLNDAELTAAINEALPKLDAYEEAKNLLAETLQTLSNANTAVSDANEALQTSWKRLKDSYRLLPSSPTRDESAFIDAGVPNEQKQSILSLFDALETAQDELRSANDAYDAAKENKKTLQKESIAARDAALEIWRGLNYESYKSRIGAIRGATSYSQRAPGQSEDSNANCFIYVTISVLNNEAFAQELREDVLRAVPELIENNIPTPTGYASNSCSVWTTADLIAPTNVGYTRSSVIKYAVILGAISLIVSSLVIILLDRTDKRLRDVDQVGDLFKIPVLGVIPTITKKEKNQPIDTSATAETAENGAEDAENESSTEVTE